LREPFKEPNDYLSYEEYLILKNGGEPKFNLELEKVCEKLIATFVSSRKKYYSYTLTENEASNISTLNSLAEKFLELRNLNHKIKVNIEYSEYGCEICLSVPIKPSEKEIEEEKIKLRERFSNGWKRAMDRFDSISKNEFELFLSLKKKYEPEIGKHGDGI
jgi:hypothetical protein